MTRFTSKAIYAKCFDWAYKGIVKTYSGFKVRTQDGLSHERLRTYDNQVFSVKN